MSNKKIIYAVTMFISAILLYFGIKYILPVFLPFMAAYLIAWSIRKPVGFIKNKIKLPETLTAAIFIILTGAVFISIFGYILGTIANEAVEFFKNFPAYSKMIEHRSVNFCGMCDKMLGLKAGSVLNWCSSMSANIIERVNSHVIPNITAAALKTLAKTAACMVTVLTIFVSAVLWVKDIDIHKKYLKNNILYENIHVFTNKLCSCGLAYIKTQLIIASIVASSCTIGFLITKSKYPFLYGIMIAIFDAFPVCGSGVILIPTAICMLLNKNILGTAVMVTVFLICQLSRDFLEPKLLGNRLGVPGIYMLISVYTGIKLFGISGIITGPAALVVIMTLSSELRIRLEPGKE